MTYQNKKLTTIREEIEALPDQSKDGIDLRQAKTMAIAALDHANGQVAAVLKLAS